jgi:hypothetical protein
LRREPGSRKNLYQVVEKASFPGLVKNIQMQGAQNQEE